MSARGKHRLESSAAALAHQREWFAGLGEPVVLVDADVPHELLRAMGIPYVVNQWWASICAAKQRGPDYLAVLRERGYPDDLEQYSAISLGSTFDREEAPWGGLPEVGAFVTQVWTDAHRGIAEAWERERGVPFFALEKAVANQLPERWWERIAHEWEEVVGTARLDLMSAELERLTAFLEGVTGKRLDEARLARILELANEQQEWSRRTRDLLAATRPAPLDIVDSIPAVMLPQWHRGTEWARDAARTFHEEIEARIAAGDAVCPDERVRLMWIGRGLWFNLGFYQHFQREYGAVFVWSMYLAIAADGYPRYGGAPLRQLAARFAAFTDFLGMPGWAEPWYLKEARSHGIDGVVHLVTAESRSPYFVTRALEEAGLPVLEIDANNADPRDWDEDAFVRELSEFIERRVAR
jgi:benzoyl-CoA reductase/2-hydroxyglutaryl-CoA dehydratase subunit BcrC/BadD/HgdB